MLLINQVMEIDSSFVKYTTPDFIEKLKAYINSNEPDEFWEVLFRYSQGWQDYDHIPLGGYNIAPVLKRYLTGDDYETVAKGLALRRSKTLSAYYYLSRVYKKEIVKSGTRIMDDLSILNYLKRVLNEH